jgi:hypothetical protein
MATSQAKIEQKLYLFSQDQSINLDRRPSSSFRPVLLVVERRQFDRLSILAQTLIESVELLSSTTFSSDTKKLAQLVQVIQALSRSIIGFGC